MSLHIYVKYWQFKTHKIFKNNEMQQDIQFSTYLSHFLNYFSRHFWTCISRNEGPEDLKFTKYGIHAMKFFSPEM